MIDAKNLLLVFSVCLMTGCVTKPVAFVGPADTPAPAPAPVAEVVNTPPPPVPATKEWTTTTDVAKIQPVPGSGAEVTGLNRSSINVTPYTDYVDSDNEANAKGGDFANSYTRLRIDSALTTDKKGERAKLLTYQERGWLKRYFVGMKFDSNLSVKVNAAGYEATIPLVTVSHQSTTDGELWSRSVSRSLMNFPLFLVRPDGEASVPTFQIKMAGTKEYSSNMAAKALDIVVSSVQAIAPEAGVLTKLSAQASRDKSHAIDSAINRLFSNGITEEQVVHRDLRKWHPSGGIAVTFTLPSESDWNVSEGTVGTWRITFEEPRPSIFGDWRICKDKVEMRCAGSRIAALKNVHLEMSSAQVLNYPILRSPDGLGSISAYLLKQPWYAKGMSEFTNDKDKDRALADSMCLEIQNSIVSLGLNSDDANIVTWAFMKGFPRASKMHNDAFSATTAVGSANVCANAVSLIETTRAARSASS